ncbi:glycoside hydrolase family 9 protein [filamentous cyanobacterium LEGE 11480]|uniref:Glycoside hydrolase family 9 protein n=1 Tax=Romeriopsis navalis LEGE 11480 TaxID=2777977 RepID=A0A928VJI5_9CYAN|nr:glycoside hydrolase family 9 protein [Romeriopsis navalis]MBE9029751.1 glycoside hydrolase family 9 protein [Romeriopsis navalis LEGE 11480]
MRLTQALSPISLAIALATLSGVVYSVYFQAANVARGTPQSTSQGLGEQRLTPQQVYPVRSDIVAIEIHTGHVIRGKQQRFQRQFGDYITPHRHATKDDWVKRFGRARGALVGHDRKQFYGFDRLTGKDLNISNWRNSENIRIQSSDDPRYRSAQSVKSVHRKMRPRDTAQIDTWKFQWATTHTLYLTLPTALTPGKTYTITSPDPNVAPITFRYQPTTNRSEAVQVSHLGFRPDDPGKVAFLSAWMGDGGGVNYPIGQTFWLVNSQGKQVFTGKTRRSRRADEAEDGRGLNHNHTDVDVMDFSDFQQPGQYRVCVATIGCSFPFKIGPQVWQSAFYTSVRGLYHQRSGIALGAPYTSYKRPRAFHPNDGVKVYQATARLVDNDQGIWGKTSFLKLLPQTKTTKILPQAWGGYFDAGDWDRRIQHVEVSRSLIELAELFPDYFERLNLNLPESNNQLPDIIDEALWNLDFYRRMQAADGGISGGIQSASYPKTGEASWQETADILAYKPDPWSSYLYVAGAAQIAHWLRDRQPKLAATYRLSAVRAMDYAERYWHKPDPSHKHFQLRDARNLAALAMLRLTEQTKWHQVFEATTVFTKRDIPIEKWDFHDQRDAAFLYLRLPAHLTQAKLRQNVHESFFKAADKIIRSGQKSAHKWAKEDDNAPIGWGNSLGSPKTVTLLRAHHLSQDDRYLKAATLASQFSAGANPLNLVYTTGLGHRSPRNPLIIDQRITGQAPPPGITVYGPLNPAFFKNDWFTKLMEPAMYPAWSKWPTTEAYFDVFTSVAMSEFTVMQTIGPTAYTWGYLAARQSPNR